MPEDPVLPIMNNQKMNGYLKEIADLAKISNAEAALTTANSGVT